MSDEKRRDEMSKRDDMGRRQPSQKASAERKSADRPERKPEDKSERRPEDRSERKPAEKPERKPEDRSERKPADKSERRPVDRDRTERRASDRDGAEDLDIPAYARKERVREQSLAPRRSGKQNSFLDEYGRYIIYGVVAVLLVVVLVVAGIGIFKKGNQGGESTESSTVGTSAAENTESDTAEQTTEAPKDTSLKKEAVPELNELMNQYYDSMIACDLATLTTLVEDAGSFTQEKLDKQREYIEDYLNIVCYTKAGLNDGEYILYVYSEIKFASIETSAPQLNHYYINEAVDGKYRLANGMLDNDKVAYMNEMDQHQDVLDLIAEVDEKLTDAMESDDKLDNLVQMLLNIPGTGGDTTTEASGDEETFYVNGELFYRVEETVYPKEVVRVRASNSLESEVLGTLYLNDYVTRTGYSENWSQIIYKGQTAYVYKGFLTTNKPE